MLNRPSPHGEGGLKSELPKEENDETMSLPTRGGWIEIADRDDVLRNGSVPPHTGRVD